MPADKHTRGELPVPVTREFKVGVKMVGGSPPDPALLTSIIHNALNREHVWVVVDVELQKGT